LSKQIFLQIVKITWWIWPYSWICCLCTKTCWCFASYLWQT